MSTETLHASIFPEAVVIPAGVRDLCSFRDWAHSDEFPNHGSISWVQGEIVVDMSPEEIGSHNALLFDLVLSLAESIDIRDLGQVLGERVLFVNEEGDVSTEPDLIFCTWESLKSGRVTYREHVAGSGRMVEVAGSPDLIVEIVSQGSVRKDRQILFKAYFAAGVREYWLIDARGAEIDFRIHRRGRSGFVKSKEDAEGFVPSIVLGRAFRLTRERNPVGRWQYRLLAR